VRVCKNNRVMSIHMCVTPFDPTGWYAPVNVCMCVCLRLHLRVVYLSVCLSVYLSVRACAYAKMKESSIHTCVTPVDTARCYARVIECVRVCACVNACACALCACECGGACKKR